MGRPNPGSPGRRSVPEVPPDPPKYPGSSVFGDVGNRHGQDQPPRSPSGWAPPVDQTLQMPQPYPDQWPPPEQVPQPTEPAAPGLRRPPEHRRPGPQRRPPGQRSDRQPSRRPQARRSGVRLPVGAGALVGLAGLTCFLLALLVLPWFSVGDQDVTLPDIRTAFTVGETQDADPVPEPADAVPSTPPDDGIPSADEVSDAVEQQVRDAAAQAATTVIDTGKARYLELYVERLWIGVAVGVALAVVFSTILAPRSMALSLILGFRRLSGVVTVLAGVVHGAALWVVFSGDGAPDPAFGVWLGLVGLGGVLIGCILGPRRS
jgi:hypothetical protein